MRGIKKARSVWEQAGGQRDRANSTRRSPGADEIEIDDKAGDARCDHGPALLCILVDPSSVRQMSGGAVSLFSLGNLARP
jgi:hypothetical protein